MRFVVHDIDICVHRSAIGPSQYVTLIFVLTTVWY